jgi:hypothetical protein
MRYTEVRMSRIAHELLADIEKATVDFTPNYDESETEPSVLPTRVPNLLINGQTGIAVGMATNIPPHNLTETVNACIALLDDPALPLAALMQHAPVRLPDRRHHQRHQEIAAYRTGRTPVGARQGQYRKWQGDAERSSSPSSPPGQQGAPDRAHRQLRKLPTASPATACAMVRQGRHAHRHRA